MKFPPPPAPTGQPLIGRKPWLAAILLLLGACQAQPGTALARLDAHGADRTAVFSRADRHYTRAQRPDGSFVPETYVFKEGGNFGGPRVDATMDRLSFDDVSKVIGRALASQNYVPGEDRESLSLLILVYWGTTIVPDDVMPHGTRESDQLSERAGGAGSAIGGELPGSANAAALLRQSSSLLQDAQADSLLEGNISAGIDAKNANILGFTDDIRRVAPTNAFVLDPYLTTLRAEVEQDRYYVVLLAYDYQAARRTGAKRLLWETRFSIPETGNDFEDCFPKMAAIAAHYFGEDSHGIVRHNLADGRVEVGEPTSLGPVSPK
jgi:hypothetical protein